MILKHVAEAERHVSEGEQHIARQRDIIAKLKRDGHATVDAEVTLRMFLETQSLHEHHLEVTRSELRALDADKP